ncbi:LysM domain-containing protein [Micrococcaceae bacterium Sec5.7]
MGFLDDLKKNLGFAGKDEQKPAEQQQKPEQQPAAADAEAGNDSQADAQMGAGVGTGTGAQQQAATAQAAAAQPARVTEVVVEPGDTLSGIAVQFGVDLNALIAVNADIVPNPDLIYPGQVLRLP